MYPRYKAMGMDYADFWERDVELARDFREYAKEKEKQELEKRNWEMWWQGMYFYEAVCDASPIFNPYAKRGTKPVPYREKPYEIFPDGVEKGKLTAEQKSDMKAKAVMEMFMANINKKFEKKGGEEDS